MLIRARHGERETAESDAAIYLRFNAGEQPASFELPSPPGGQAWTCVFDTVNRWRRRHLYGATTTSIG